MVLFFYCILFDAFIYSAVSVCVVKVALMPCQQASILMHIKSAVSVVWQPLVVMN